MTMKAAVDGSGESELVVIAAELERYWAEQWRRAKEICDLLEQRLAGKTLATRAELRLVGPPAGPETGDAKPSRADLRLVDR
jgi:hypothetical protein